MPLDVRHDQVATLPDDPSVEVGADEWNEAHVLQMDGVNVLGRAIAGTGPVAEIDLTSLRSLMGLGTTAAVVFGSIGVGMAAPAAGDLSALGTIRAASILASAAAITTVAVSTTAASSHAFLVANRFDQATSFARLMLQTNSVNRWSVGLRSGDDYLHFFHEATPAVKLSLTTTNLHFAAGVGVYLSNTSPITAATSGGFSTPLLQLYTNDQVYLDNYYGVINIRPGAAGALGINQVVLSGTSSYFPGNAFTIGNATGGVNLSLQSNVTVGNVSGVLNFNNTAQPGGVNVRLIGVGGGGILIDDGAGVYYFGVSATRAFYTSKFKIGNNVAPTNYLDVQGGIAKATASTGVIAGFWSSDTAAPFGIVGAITGSATAGDRTFEWQTQEMGTGNQGRIALQRFAGNVGVGTLPLTAFALHVYSKSGVQNTSYPGDGGDVLIEGINRPFYPTGGTNAGNLVIATTSAIAIDTGGSIVLGGKYSGDLYSAYAKIKSGKDTGVAGGYTGYLAFGTQSGSGIVEAARILSNLRVLIGTTSDVGAYILQTQGSIYAAVSNSGNLGATLVLNNSAGSVSDMTQIEFRSGNTIRSVIRSFVEGSPFYGELSFWTGSTSYNRRMTIGGSTGYVGINTASPRQYLDVEGKIVTGWGDYFIGMHYLDGVTYRMGMAFNSGGRGLDIGTYYADSGYLTFSTNSERMRIDDTGQVMIGTTGKSAVNANYQNVWIGGNALLLASKATSAGNGLTVCANLYFDASSLGHYISTGVALSCNIVPQCFYVMQVATGSAGAGLGATIPLFAASSNGFGYGGDITAGSLIGAGGSVTQITSKATTVVLNTVCGQITTHGAVLGGGAIVTFQVTNNKVAATDVIILNHASGGTPALYTITCCSVYAGGFTVRIMNNGVGAGEALVLGFAIIKATIT